MTKHTSFSVLLTLSSQHCNKNVNTAIETPHKGIVGCESLYRNRVFRSTPACPRDHEVLLRHGRGNKRLLCLTKYTSTGNNTNTHISTSKMLFRTFWGFCYLLSCCYRIDSSSGCQHILLPTDLLLLGDVETMTRRFYDMRK